MVRKPTTGLPLVFALAIAASASPSHALQVNDPHERLRPGSLQGLLDQLPPGLDEGAAGPKSRLQIGQWFNNNWFNCFQGKWRRC